MTENSTNTTADLDVVGIGNAIVDVISPVDEAFLAEHDLVKGAMGLIDADRAQVLYAAMPPAEESSGGSVANTIAGVAAMLPMCLSAVAANSAPIRACAT